MSDPKNCTIVMTGNRVNDSINKAMYPDCEVIHPEGYILDNLIEVLRSAWNNLIALQNGTQKAGKK